MCADIPIVIYYDETENVHNFVIIKYDKAELNIQEKLQQQSKKNQDYRCCYLVNSFYYLVLKRKTSLHMWIVNYERIIELNEIDDTTGNVVILIITY